VRRFGGARGGRRYLRAVAVRQATAAFESKDVARAEALVTPLAEGDGATAEACSLLGQIRMRQKRPVEAVAQFERAVAKSPSSAPMHSRLGEALLAQAAGVGGAECEALLQRARAELERAAGMDAGCIDAQMGLLRYHLMAPAAGPAGAAERYAAAAGEARAALGDVRCGRDGGAFKRFDLAEPYYREYARASFPIPG
jgi:predicted Zn-dependent protease